MLNYQDGRTVFRLMCLAILVGIVIDAALAWAMIAQGTLGSKLIGTVLNAGILAACVPAFKKIVEKQFLAKDILPFSRLHHFASDRNDALRNNHANPQNAYLSRQSLIARTLQLAEETLRGWCPGSHFELCVFVDPDQPLLFSYFDSNRDFTARSMAERARQPSFYLDKNYEVAKLLRKPTSRPQVIGDTHDRRANYSFTTAEQRKQIRSTLLLCIDIDTPCALVITSDAKSAFSLKDEHLLSFVHFMADLIKYDLFASDFIRNVKSLRPDLFPDHDQPASARPSLGAGSQQRLPSNLTDEKRASDTTPT